MIRQKIVTQCSLIRLPGFPDNTVINYVFCPHVLSQNSDFFFPIPRLYFLPSPQKLSLLSYYCNPGLIKSPDRMGGVWCGSHIMLSAHLPAQLLAVVVFSLITSCQYANKLPRLFSILGLHCKIYGIFGLWTGIEPTLLAGTMWNPNHWTTRELSNFTFLWHVYSFTNIWLSVSLLFELWKHSIEL